MLRSNQPTQAIEVFAGEWLIVADGLGFGIAPRQRESKLTLPALPVVFAFGIAPRQRESKLRCGSM